MMHGASLVTQRIHPASVSPIMKLRYSTPSRFSFPLAIALIAVGAVLAVLGILQHQLIIRIHIDHLAVVLLAIGVIVMVAGIFGLVMQGRGSAPAV